MTDSSLPVFFGRINLCQYALEHELAVGLVLGDGSVEYEERKDGPIDTLALVTCPEISLR